MHNQLAPNQHKFVPRHNNHNYHRFGFNKELTARIKHAILWAGFTGIISLSASLLMFHFERVVNPALDTLGETIWWWLVTIAGLGYSGGDPVTIEGKLLGTFVIVTSLILLAIVVTEFADLIRLTYERKQKGIIRINYQDHVIIYGYTSLTAGVVKLLRTHFGKELKIVLISNDVDFNPFPKEVDFIYANPINKDTFVEANIMDAMASIILANDRFSDPDAYSLVIATGVEMYNPKAVNIVEIMDDQYKELYKQGNIEAFIRRKELLKDLLDKNDDSKLIRIIEKETPLVSTDDPTHTVELV